MSHQVDEFNVLKENFLKVCKRVLKENLTQNRVKHVEYLHDLIDSYNSAIRFIAANYPGYDIDLKKGAIDECKYLRGKIIKCYQKLHIRETLPSDSYFTQLDLALILKYFSTQEIQFAFSDPSVSASSTPAITPASSTSSLNINFDNQTENNIGQAMAMTNTEFLALASRTLNKNYDGNPLALSAFINSIELLKEVVPNNLNRMFTKFVESKLEGKALDSIPQNPNSVDEIILALRTQIKPDNSKVVAGRLLALKPDRAKMSEFTEQAESLADALQRSLIIEGITQAKAREMTIERTVELCRNATRSDLVKSILAASKFDSPKEVVAKYVVEANTEEKEKQIFQFRAQNNKRGFNKNRGRFKNQKQNNYNNGYNNNRNFNNNSNYRGGRGRYRGRGRDRGGYSNNNYQRNRPQQYVRYAENSPGPSQDGRAIQTQQPAQQVYIPFQQN